ncbi:hypothetical protein H072_947 [Dactylellina haptotyla CBS 200.50]|uniref:SCP domain-containing protein n=1 Tax=Dactylellina haptotyla (strain CBS 200.50) TaxID=1284197 RepID=S8CBE0_DACHA|nr:hypothetical protein H072_947 [Dactylellina haptotyla CBS 200.50]
MEDTNPFFRSYHPPPNILPYLDPEDLNLEQQAGNHTHGLPGSTDPSPSYYPGPSAPIHNSVPTQGPFVVHNTLVSRSGNTNPHVYVDQPAQYGRPPPILGTRGSSTFIQTADEYFRFHNLRNVNHSSSVSRVARQAPSAGGATNHNGPLIERLRLIATIKGVYAALVVVETNLVGEPQVVDESSGAEFLPLVTRDGWQWLEGVHGILLQSYKTFSTTLHGSALVSIGNSGQVFWKSAMKTMIRLLERQESDHLDLSMKEVYHFAYLGIALSGVLFTLSKDPKDGLISLILGQWCLQVKNIFGTGSHRNNRDWEMAQKEWANWIRFALCNPNLEINREFISGRPFDIGYILRIPELFFRLLPRTINGIGDRFYLGLMRPQSVDLDGSQECPDRVYRLMKGHMLLGSLFAIANTLGFKMELDMIYVMVLENWLKLTCQKDALEFLSRLLDDADISYTSDKAFKAAVLNVTNTYRDWYNATALTWNDTLAEAGETAVEDCIFVHSGQPYGENLAAGYANVSAAITAWKDEVDQYNYNHPDFSMATGHFTQLVWQNTTQVGCARKECGGEGEAPGWFVACEYAPHGNVLTQFGDNVDKQIKGPGSGVGRYEVPIQLLVSWALVQAATLLA